MEVSETLFSGRIFPDSRCFCIGSMGRKSGKPNLIERFLNRLRAGEHYVDSLKTFGITELDEKQFDMLMEMAEKELPFEEKIRVLYSISRSMKFMKKIFTESATISRAEMHLPQPAGNI